MLAILKQGLVQIYTGEGKGKTTASLGLAWRMLGCGGSVHLSQFLKPANHQTGESILAQQFPDRLTHMRIEQDWNMFTSWDNPDETNSMTSRIDAAMDQITQLANQGKYDLMILDEIVFCYCHQLVTLQAIDNLINSRASHVELVFTGRGADDTLISRANLVTEMKLIKHPYDEGIIGRRGIEF